MNSEITVEVLCTRPKLFGLLAKRGFVFKERFHLTDYYYATIPDGRKQEIDFKTTVKKSLIIRDVKLERRYFSNDGMSTLMYKKKEFDKDETVIAEEKILCNLENPVKARKIFGYIGLKNWVTKKTTCHVFRREHIEILVQEVEGVGLFIEVEQFSEEQKGTPKRILSMIKKFVQSLDLPIGDDYNVSIAERVYQVGKMPVKSKAKKPRVLSLG